MKQFGGKLTKELATNYSKSKNWKGGKFMNLEETGMDMSVAKLPKLIYKQVFEKAGRMPSAPLAIQKFETSILQHKGVKPQFIWYGHSALLMRWMGKTILMDPMLGPDASPIAPFSTKRFSENTLEVLDHLPEIDLVLMTHDHYDHLDLASFRKLQAKTSRWHVALGVGRHLTSWGIDSSKIQEFDWWESFEFSKIKFTFTPSRHFSGRGLSDRSKSLWGGWVMKSDEHNIYWSGDGGYGEHFKEIGRQFGPFDFGFMECGQYNENWHQIHMYPEEAVQAAIDAGVKTAMAVHWGGFALAMHHWKDPIDRFAAACDQQKLNLSTPQLGEIFSINSETHRWWEHIE